MLCCTLQMSLVTVMVESIVSVTVVLYLLLKGLSGVLFKWSLDLELLF